MNLLNGAMTMAYFADDGESIKCLYVEFEFCLPKNYRILYLGFSFIAFYS